MESGPPPSLPWSRGRRAAATLELQSPPLPQGSVQTSRIPATTAPAPQPAQLPQEPGTYGLEARRGRPGGEISTRREGKEAGRRVGSEEEPGRVEGGCRDWGVGGGGTKYDGLEVVELALRRWWMGVGVRVELWKQSAGSERIKNGRGFGDARRKKEVLGK